MTDSMLSCADCGTDLVEHPFEPRACGPCYESESQAGLRTICPLCRGRRELTDSVSNSSGQTVVIRSICHECGGEGELTFPRRRAS